MPELVGKKTDGKLVICNLQKTPLDNTAALKIYAKCDDVMRAVMQRLNMAIPPFILSRRVKVTRNPNEILLQTYDFDGTPATIFSSVTCGTMEMKSDPFKIINPGNSNVTLTLHFYGHYNEPPLEFIIPTGEGQRYIDLHYNPLTGVWTTEDKGETVEFFQVTRRQLTSFQKVPDHISKTKPPVPISGGFSVDPKTDCPHFSAHIPLGIVNKIEDAYKGNTCKTCNDKSENWMCLTCGNTYCSRYVQGHARQHFEDSHHPVAISFSDLSIWCYSCDDYITHQNLKGITQTLSLVKFG